MKHINPSIGNRSISGARELKPLAYYTEGIVVKQDPFVLSEAITLLESEKNEHKVLANQILAHCYKHRTPTIRLGITGSPGVGKSTFIDSIAGTWAKDDKKVGILTIDPSSTEGKGSILGDKTRMEQLVQNPNIFIRPSPSNRHLGGVNQYTFEAIIMCEAAGIERIFIETVGVGQSEVSVSSFTDGTILLVLPGSGDSLQGIKKGVIEKADLIVINKADGAGETLAKASVKEFQEAIHYKTKHKQIQVTKYSSIGETGKAALLEEIENITKDRSAAILSKRKEQEKLWLKKALQAHIVASVDAHFENPKLKNKVKDISNKETPFEALDMITAMLSIDVNLTE